jgi:nucleoside-triphosphatase
MGKSCSIAGRLYQGEIAINIFLTGKIQVGKSTLIQRLVTNLNVRTGGFKTARHFTGSRHDGFVMEAAGHENVTADFRPYIAEMQKNGHWKAITETFEIFGVRLLKKSLGAKNDLILMDELGYFESAAFDFQQSVFQCLSSSIPVLGVIKMRSTGFLDRVRARKDLNIFLITEENREGQYWKLEKILKEILGEAR